MFGEKHMFFYENHQFNNDRMYNSFLLENCDFPSHFHQTFELIFVSKGTLQVTINNETYTLHKDEVAFIFPNQIHSFSSAEHSRFVLLIFPPDMVNSFYKKYQDQIPINNVITYHPSPSETIQLKNMFDCKSFLYQMCSQLIEQTEFISSSGIDGNHLLYKLLTFVQKNYNEECLLSQAAEQFGYDYTYLSKYFQRKMDISFTSYLNQYRISQACVLLQTTNETFSSIATKCGYDNLRTFNRNFKNFTGITPTEYKRTNTRNIY